MKTMKNIGPKTEVKLALITFVIGFTISSIISWLMLTKKINVEFDLMFLIIIATYMSSVFGAFAVLVNRRDLIFSDTTITLKEFNVMLRPIMPRRTITFSWDDVLAWDENASPWDGPVKDPVSLHLLFQEGEQKKMYRVPGSWIFIDKKHIRFAEFKQHLAPFLDKIPRDHTLLSTYGKSQRYSAYATMIAGWVLIAGCIANIVLASYGVPASGMTVIAGIVGVATLKISKQLFDDAEKPIKKTTQ